MAMARSGNQPDEYARVDECIQNLQDKDCHRWYKITRSPATREAAMAGIVGELEEGHLPLEVLDIRCLTIVSLCGISIKKGTPREACLAYRAVALLLLALRDGSPGALLNEAFPALSKAVRDSHSDTPTKVVAAIDCLAAASFAGVRRAEEVQRSMEVIWRVIVPPTRSRSAKIKTQTPATSPVVLAAALSAWTFLLTTVVSATDTQRKADRGRWSAAIASLTEILDADDRRVRMAAGEALAVCVELNLTKQHAKGKDGTGALLAAKVSDLATEPAGKHADNSFLHQQKELFGQIAAFLDHGEPPVASWEWHGMMKVSTWVRLAQLNFLRRLVGNGFLEHVQRNPVLKEAFCFGRVEGKPLSIHKEESSKTIDDLLLGLNNDRDWRSWEYRHIFCVETGYRSNWPAKLLQLGWH